MSDFKHIQRGDLLPRKATTINAILDAAKAHKMPSAAGGPIIRGLNDPVKIGLLNKSGAAVPRGGVLALGDATFSAETSEAAFDNDLIIDGNTPAEGNPFGIALQTVPIDTIGKFAVAGVTRCLLTVSSEAHTYAKPQASTGSLISAATGPCRILWKQAAGYGSPRKALVLFEYLPALSSVTVVTCVSLVNLS